MVGEGDGEERIALLGSSSPRRPLARRRCHDLFGVFGNVIFRSTRVVTSSFFTSASYTDNERRAWGLSGTFDFFRRFLIGGSKISGVVSIILFICSTVGIIRATALEKNHAWIVAPAFLLGALFELFLSVFPIVNRAVSPVYNGLFLLTERFFLEVASIMILLCGLEQLPNIPSRFLPDRKCVHNVRYVILIPVLIFSIPHFISSIAEHGKYQHVAAGGGRYSELLLSHQ